MTRKIDGFTTPASHREKRVGSSRSELNCQATVKQIDTQMFQTMLVDLSATGFRLYCPASLRKDKKLMIKIPGLEMLQAEIMWENDSHYGCRFTQPLYPAVFDHIVKNNTA